MTFTVKLTLMMEQSWNHAGKKMDDKKSQSEDEGTLAHPGGTLRKNTNSITFFFLKPDNGPADPFDGSYSWVQRALLREV